MKPLAELEQQMIHPQQWHLAPHPIHQIAEECAKEGVFTGIAYDDYYGWVILQRDDNGTPRVAWTQHHFKEEEHYPEEEPDDMDFLF